jgi:hypothetical protein
METLNADWIRLGNQLGVDWTAIDRDEWIKGCDHELEHWQTVNGDPEIIAGIALDHLREIPKYYQMLEKIEGEHAR